MQNRNILIGVVVALLLVLGIGGYAYYQTMMKTTSDDMTVVNDSMDEGNNTDAMMLEETAEEMTAGTESATPQNGEIVVEGSNFKFAPNSITIKAGEKVRLVFKNSGGMHDFVVDELGIKTQVIQGGQQEVVEFTADKPGTYEFYCSVGQHRQMGMVGTLIVQ